MKARTADDVGSRPAGRIAPTADAHELARLKRALARSECELAQALARQTATAEVLQAISRSPTELQPVLEAVAQRAALLCRAQGSRVWLAEGDHLRAMTSYGPGYPESGFETRPLRATSVGGRAFLERRCVHVEDVVPLLDTEYPDSRELQARNGYRTVLVVPMLREGEAIGLISLLRNEVRPFAPSEIALVETFADQAVIAIQNVRLFNETRRALEHQTATAEVLKVISESPTDVQPVFDAICERAMALSSANIGGVTRFDGESVHLVAFQGISPEADAAMRAAFPMPPSRASTSARAVLEGVPIEIADVEADPDYELKPQMRLAGYRSNLSVPMLRDGKAVGSITVCRPEPGTFPRPVVELLQTFADQAVIAIENVRLFNELQARNREVSQALDQQTATSEILRVISSSPTDVQPVFDAIADAALVLCRARSANLLIYDGKLLHLAARALVEPGAEGAARELFPRPAGTDTVAGRAVMTHRIAVIPDVFADPDYAARDVARLTGARSFLGVPLLRDGQAVGAIVVGRLEPGAIPDQQVALLQTFADQAVIAIENVRLFNETKEALEQQTATAEILQVISESPTDVRPVFDAIAQRARRLCGGVLSGVALYDGRLVHMEAYDGATEQIRTSMYGHFPRAVDRATMITRAIAEARPVQMPDVQADPEYLFKEPSREVGIRSYLAVPMVREGRVVGSMSVGRREGGLFPDKQVQLLQTFADQAVIAIENVRLFNELREKGEQLELASRHKSQFLANMSHELRTPLNAIIGFTRIVLRRTKDQIEPKQAENLEKILASGQHLLALINAVLDLSKIEAGRVEVAASEVELASVLRQCVLTIEPLVKAEAVSLVADLEGALPRLWVDEEKLRQIVINLLGNAAKFTTSGSITLAARAEGETVRISVTDTGIGIAADKLGLIFEEFEQADASSTRPYGGTGLGLAIARRLARLIGGEVEAQSVPGRGSTFTLTLPLRDCAPAAA